MTSTDLPATWTDIAARFGHVTALYKGRLIVWGGSDSRTGRAVDVHRLDVYNSVARKWSRSSCNGSLPDRMTCLAARTKTAQVIGCKLYMICMLEQVDCYALDLTTHHWVKLEVAGVPPLTGLSTSWLWKEKVYLFGGYGKQNHIESPVQSHTRFLPNGRHYAWNNQLVALNTQTMAWEWPRGADPPSPRTGHSCTLIGDFMLLFAGENDTEWLNDLHALHMPSHRWSRALVPTGEAPEGRYLHSLTAVGGQGRAVLCGGVSGPPERLTLSDCWLLAWAEDGKIRWERWKRQERVYGMAKYLHQAHYVPATARLFLLGGTDEKDYDDYCLHHRFCVSIPVDPLSLVDLCIRVSLGNQRLLSYWKNLAIPVHLKAAIEDEEGLSTKITVQNECSDHCRCP